METKIYIGKAWGKVRQDREGVIVEIKNKEQVFKWMPTYQQVDKILELLKQVEELNKTKHS